MILLKDTEERYLNDEYMQGQVLSIFGDTDSYLEEFRPFWNEMLPQIIKMHAITGMGEYAGSGAVDFSEAFILYLFGRIIQPNCILELGTGGGCSTCFLARSLELNQLGEIHTVELSTAWEDVCTMFQEYKTRGIIVQNHGTDAVQYLRDTSLEFDLTFTDADHRLEPCEQTAQLLKAKFPDAIHLYHEAGMSYRSSDVEQSYVSMTNLIGSQYERDAMENVFGEEAEHYVFVGSCGLGYVKLL